MNFTEDTEETEKKKRKKPRQPAEILDTPRRYLVRSGLGNAVVRADSKQEAAGRDNHVALMGTHEDQAHAEKRMGW